MGNDKIYSTFRLSSFSVLLIMALLIVMGLATVPLLNVQYTPTKSQTDISVSFSWPEASARIIEQEVTSKIEGALASITGVNSISSTTSKGSGSISIEFKPRTEMDVARFEIASQIRNIYPKLPDGVSYPTLSLSTSGETESPVLNYTINSSLPADRIENYINTHIITHLAQINGVDKVNLSGATPYEWVLTFDADKARIAGIDAQQIATAFTTHFSGTTIGMSVEEHEDGTQERILLKIRNSYSPVFDDIVITGKDGKIFYMRDLVTARYQEAKPTRYFRLNGLNTITLDIYAEKHTNLLTVTNAVKSEMERLRQAFPDEISAQLSYDASTYVREELNKIFFRTALCFVILLAFVLVVSRSFRYLLIIATTLMVNILVGILFYNIFNLDIHLYSLAGITVSLGLIIDTSIIMVDHYSYYHDKRVFTSILGALLTTIGALAIIFLLPDTLKQNLTDFALVIIINLAVSLAIARMFIPALLDKLPLQRGIAVHRMRGKRRIVRFNRIYMRYLQWSRRHRWIYVTLAVLGFGIPLFLLPSKIAVPKDKEETRWSKIYNKTIGSNLYQDNKSWIEKALGGSFRLFSKSISSSNYYREPQKARLSITAAMPEGCTIHQLNDVIRSMENYISQFDEIEMFQTRVTSYDNATITVTFKPEYENTAFPVMLKQNIIASATNFGGATWRVYGIDQNYFNNNVYSGYKSNRISLSGYNYDALLRYAEQLADSLATNKRVSAPEIVSNSYDTRHNEYFIDYNREKIAAVGLHVSDYFDFLQHQLYSSSLGTLFLNGRTERIRLESSSKDAFDLWHILNSQVAIDSVNTKLSDVGTISKNRSGITINKENQSYSLSVGYDFVGSYELASKLSKKYTDIFNNEILPIGYKAGHNSYQWTEKEKIQQVLMLLVVITVIYVICAIIFESLVKPLVIIFMIPISFIGEFLIFGLFKFQFDQGGFAAFVMLCGIVVNAGIYIINEMNTLASDCSRPGLSLYLRAFNHKIIPILLTVVSTVLGLIPFLYDGPKEVFWFAFAIGAIGGTLFSLIALTIYLPIFLPAGRR